MSTTHAAGRPSELLLRLFAGYTRRYLRRHFHAVRLLRGGGPPAAGGEAPRQPLVVYLNHPSWWDPLVGLHLALTLLPGRRHHSPMDAEQLERYGFFRRLGFFPVERGSAAGARRFLATAEALLAEPRTVLWITPQGRFADPRERPVELESGLARLARRMGHGQLVPLALEYPFWEERFPEALAGFGRPLAAADLAGLPAPEVGRRLAAALETAQDQLAAAARRRDPAAFDTLLGGRAGVGGVYDRWRALVARLRGERFVAGHRPGSGR